MADQPINPGAVEWSGENPGMYLKLDESGPFTCLVSFFRVVYSPHGGGHGVVILMDPQGCDPSAVNAFYTDNRALAEYLKSNFVAQFAAFKGNALVPNLPIREATSFSHAGDARSAWTETIRGPGVDIALTWSDLGQPFLVDYKPEHSATGQHHMASLFIPGQRADVVVNGVRGIGDSTRHVRCQKHDGVSGLFRNLGAVRMKATALHPWQVNTHEAIAIQKRLRAQVLTENTLGELRYIAGADIATSKDSPKAYAGVVVLSYPELEVVEERGLEDEVTFPYIPGLLAFREGPLLVKVFEQLTTEPDVLVFDGQGLAHPRGMGIATHLGLVFEKPSIGCAKSLLFGRYQDPDPEKGAWADLRDSQGRVIGAALRSKTKTTPIFVSIGHRLDLPTAIRILMACTRGVRIPEPTRLAHNFVTKLRRGGGHSRP